MHEFAHIADYQKDPWKTRLLWSKRDRKRGHRMTRMNHDDRPEEHRAENVVWEAEETLKRQTTRCNRIFDAIIELALEMERYQKS